MTCSGFSVHVRGRVARVAIGAIHGSSRRGSTQTRTSWRVARAAEREQVSHDIDGEAAGDVFRVLGIHVLGQYARGDRRYRQRRCRLRARPMRVAESGGTWTQVGADIDGEAAAPVRSVSMSADGTRVAIAPLTPTTWVYEESGGTWTQVGSDIDGEAAATIPGTRYPCPRMVHAWRSALSTTTTPAPADDRGHVRVYAERRRRGPRWALTSTARLRAIRRRSVSMSADGTRGDQRFSPATAPSGLQAVLTMSPSVSVDQVSASINGEAQAMNPEGQYLADGTHVTIGIRDAGLTQVAMQRAHG